MNCVSPLISSLILGLGGVICLAGGVPFWLPAIFLFVSGSLLATAILRFCRRGQPDA